MLYLNCANLRASSGQLGYKTTTQDEMLETSLKTALGRFESVELAHVMSETLLSREGLLSVCWCA